VKTCGRLLKHARYYWLMLAESHLTRRLFGAMVRKDCRSAGADRIGRGRGANRSRKGGDGPVSEKKPLEMRRFQVLALPEEPEL